MAPAAPVAQSAAPAPATTNVSFPPQRRSAWPVALISLAVLLGIGILGWIDSITFIAPMDQGNPIQLSLFPLAILAGVACFFNPCAVPLFPLLVGRILTKETGDRGPSGLRLGLAGGLGVLAFMAAFGAIVLGFSESLSMSALKIMGSSGFQILRVVAGLLFIGLAAFLLLGKSIRIPINAQRLGFTPDRPMRSMFTYGLAYTLLGIGCTAPVLGGLTLATLATGSFVEGFFLFLVASLVMAGLMVALTVIVRKQRGVSFAWTRHLPRVAAVVFIVVGLFMILEVAFPNQFKPWLHPWV